MAILDSIQKARERGASDDQILNELLKQNPAKASVFQEARKRGADSSQIIEEVIKQNPSAAPQYTKSQKVVSDFIGTTKLGEGLGQTISNAMGTQKGVIGAEDALINTQSQLLSTIKQNKAAGKDTSRLENALKELTDHIIGIGGKATEIGTGGITNKEVLGSAIRTATTIGSAGLNPAQSLVGKAAQFGAVGAVGGAGSALEENKSGTEIAKESAKSGLIGAGTGLVFGLVEKGLKALGGFLGKTGEKIQTSVIKPSQTDMKDGFNINTINKYNLGGSLKQTFEKTDVKLDSLSKELNTKLAESNASLDLNKVYENTAKRLLGNKLENFGSNTQMEGAIEKLRNEIVAVSGDNGIVSIPEAQLVKRAAGHFGAWQYGMTDPESTASQKVYNTFYNELKTSIEKNSPAGVKELNKQISELIPVMNALIRRIPVNERNATISLTDLITLSAAALEPRALSLTLLNLASKSGKAGALLSKNASKAGNAAAGVISSLESGGRVIVGR